MKVVILAGGLGTRMGNKTKNMAKPMIKIGNKPILLHIMNRYSSFGLNDFIICAGYKKESIQKFFKKKSNLPNNWKVKILDTGLKTMTGGRLKHAEKYIGKERFCFTYGDTLNDVNIQELLEFHKKNKKLATVTACNPPSKFGVLKIKNNSVTEFKEKPTGNEWVNGGYFVLEPKIFEFIENNQTVWERQPMQKLVELNQLSAFKHRGFYQPIDTMVEKEKLEKMWEKNNIPWEE